MHVGTACGVGIYVATTNISPDNESKWQQNMIGIVDVTLSPSQSCPSPRFPEASNFGRGGGGATAP